jgi:hypothetical protein
MLELRPAGQHFVLMNSAVVPANLSLSEASLSTTWRIGPSSLDHGHPAFVQVNVPPTLKALRPHAPAHLKAKRASGGIQISWIRQTRSGGDAWELQDVPLNETTESYVLDVMNGTSVVRHWTPTEAVQFYSDAELISDFGVVPNTLSFRVAQVSAAVGAGPFLERTMNV